MTRRRSVDGRLTGVAAASASDCSQRRARRCDAARGLFWSRRHGGGVEGGGCRRCYRSDWRFFSQNAVASAQRPLNVMDGNLWECELFGLAAVFEDTWLRLWDCCCCSVEGSGGRSGPAGRESGQNEVVCLFLWRSMSSLCVSIKTRPLWTEGGGAPGGGARRIPRGGKVENLEDTTFRTRSFQRTPMETRFR